MDFTVTCVCGQRFVAKERHIGQHMVCPGCSRALVPVLAVPVKGGVAAEEMKADGKTRACPYCGERILETAKKCRFCGEFLPAEKGAEVKPAADEPPVFDLCVSQWDNFWKYLICLTIVVLTGFVCFKLELPGLEKEAAVMHENALTIVLSAGMLMGMTAYFIWLGTRNARCHIWDGRIETETGIFGKKRESVPMARVTDVEIKQGMVERALGIGTVIVRTNDPAMAVVELYQIPKARRVLYFLEEKVAKTAAKPS